MKTLFCQKVDLTLLKSNGPEYKFDFPLYFSFTKDYTRHEAEIKLWEDRDKTLKALENYYKCPVSRLVRKDVIQKFKTGHGLVYSSGVTPIREFVKFVKNGVLIEMD